MTFGKLTKKINSIYQQNVLKLGFLNLLRIFHDFHLESNVKPLQDNF